MSHLRRLATPLLVVAALVAALIAVAAPASAQDPTIRVFVIGNDMVQRRGARGAMADAGERQPHRRLQADAR